MFNLRCLVSFSLCLLVVISCSAVVDSGASTHPVPIDIVQNPMEFYENIEKYLLRSGTENEYAEYLGDMTHLISQFQESLSYLNSRHEPDSHELFFLTRKINNLKVKIIKLTDQRERMHKAHISLILSKIGIQD